jgi:outer membrane lipoprotein-sorting protein
MRILLTLFFMVFAGYASAGSLARIETYLNTLASAQADFRQYNADGSESHGRLALLRPGRIRFDYADPDTSVVLAAAGALYIYDRAGDPQPEVYPLSRTPFDFLLQRQLDLKTPGLVQSVKPLDGGRILLRAGVPDAPDSGTLDLVFNQSPMQLIAWVLRTEDGSTTLVELDNLVENPELDSHQFTRESITPELGR